MIKKYEVNGVKSPTGFENGEKKANEIYNDVINDIDNINKIQLTFPEAKSVGLSYVEGFIFTFRNNENGSRILKKIEINATERILKRFSKYV